MNQRSASLHTQLMIHAFETCMQELRPCTHITIFILILAVKQSVCCFARCFQSRLLSIFQCQLVARQYRTGSSEMRAARSHTVATTAIQS